MARQHDRAHTDVIHGATGRPVLRATRGVPGDQAPLSFTVPGMIDGYLKLLETCGIKTLAEVLEPAIDHAQHGFPM